MEVLTWRSFQGHANRKCLKKKYTFTLKIIRCERKCQVFHFSLGKIEIRLQHQIKRIISGITPTFFVWIRRIWENKNITSSHRFHCFSLYFRFFGHFRLSVTFETTPSQYPIPLARSSKRVWVDISNRLWGVWPTRVDPF